MKSVFTILFVTILIAALQADVIDLKTLNRDLEPFEVECSKITDTTGVSDAVFAGEPMRQFFAFAYHADEEKWHQIPMQIDERNADWDFIFFSGERDSIFSGFDQMVVMLKDLGDRVSENTWIDDPDSKNHARYEIRARALDPNDPSQSYVGWFYLYRSLTYQDTVSNDYIDAEPASNSIYTDVYTIGHNSRGIMDHISYPLQRGLKGSTEIIDRQKVRLVGKANYAGITMEYNDTEDQLILDNSFYVDGRVRVLQRFEWHITKKVGWLDVDIPFDLTKKFYQHSMEINGKADIKSEIGCQLLRISIDIHPQIAGARFYNPYNDGLVLDRYAGDPVSKKIDIPGTFWALTSSTHGSFLQLMSIDQRLGDVQELYYCERDYGTADIPGNFTGTKDTGDMNSWGDIGIIARGNVKGKANLATNLFLFQSEIDKQTAATVAANQGVLANWWGGIFAQSYDGIKPAMVSLSVTDRGDDYLILLWTAPGDDGKTGGPVALYEMRYSDVDPRTNNMDWKVWWDLALPVENLPTPGNPGEKQTVIIRNLDRETTYYIRMRSRDDAGNWSIVSGTATSKTTPVELASFEYSTPVDGVQLQWKTISESNNYGFEVERKTETGEFQKIGFVTGNGTTNSLHSYSYYDRNNEIGVFYYRLKQIDTNGQFEYSEPIKVELRGPTDFALQQNFPNPFNGETNISFALKSISANETIENRFSVQVQIFNILGQKIRVLADEEMPVGRHQLHWNGRDDWGQNVAGGVYFYRLSVKSLQDGREVWNQMKKMVLMP